VQNLQLSPEILEQNFSSTKESPHWQFKVEMLQVFYATPFEEVHSL
jgi:hypothetical protein